MISLHWTRRQFLQSTAVVLAAGCMPFRAITDRGSRSLAAIEARVGGRVGVFALDTGNGRQLDHRPDGFFAMCSTYKWVLAAAILARVDRGQLTLDEGIPYGLSDLLPYAPITSKQVSEGTMRVGALAAAAVTVSDNTAANLLLARLGGPAAFTEFVRALGDAVTRLDRNEPALNSNAPVDLRDTTSPRAMVGLMRRLLCDHTLSPASGDQLLRWLYGCETGKNRLRAGLPQGWRAGDKTGTGERSAVNDVAIAFPADRSPILIAAYMSEGSAALVDLEAAHADIGRLVAREFG